MGVYIVWGSPASGKSTYVRNHMDEGDLVIDLDLIKQSLSMSDKTNAKDNLLITALSVREHLYKLVESNEVICNNVWVVSGLPAKESRNRLKQRLGAELIYIKATKEQCYERALNDDERTNKELQKRIIDKWFETYEEDWNDERW